MDRFSRIFALHSLLASSRYPVPRKKIEDQLECSKATAERIINDLRNLLGAPITYNRQYNGYEYGKQAETYELPGLWLNASELYALVATQQYLRDVQPGFLEKQIAPIAERIEKLLDDNQLNLSFANKKIRIIHQAARRVDNTIFQHVAGAVLKQQRLHIHYHSRSGSDMTQRDISPQRLVYYRDNWYLDAWCHLRNGLRSFSLDRINTANPSSQSCQSVPENILNQHFASSYGIFGGKADKQAVLQFTPQRAQWVAEEQWHPKQEGRWLKNGHYELTIPYSDDRELMMDILKYGADVEVVAPASLRTAIASSLRKALACYQ